MGPDKHTALLDSFRDNLADVVVIIQGLAPHCKSITDLLGLLELALTNDAQAKILLGLLPKNER